MRWVASCPNVTEGGGQKLYFRYFSISFSQTSSCPKKSLVLRHRYMVYTRVWQVSSGLKKDEMGSQVPMSEEYAEKSVFDHSRSPAPNLALVLESRLYCDKGVCYMNVCGKSH